MCSAERVLISQLRKVYSSPKGPVVALQGVSFSFASPGIYGIIGPNGAGKTTLMRIMLGLLRPTEGIVRILGRDPHLPGQAKEKIGYMPEIANLPGFMTGASFLEFVAGLFHYKGDILKTKVERALALTGLMDKSHHRISSYSKGMHQRLLLAQAILNDPEIIFLDEPTSGIDPLGVIAVREMLLALRMEGKTIILNSHQLTEIERICDRILFLTKGVLKHEIDPSMYVRGGTYILRVENQYLDAVVRILGDMGMKITLRKDGVEIQTDTAGANLILKRIVEEGLVIYSLAPQMQTLEDLFIQYSRSDESAV